MGARVDDPSRRRDPVHARHVEVHQPTSGWSASARATASSPVSASPTTRRSGCVASKASSPDRNPKHGRLRRGFGSARPSRPVPRDGAPRVAAGPRLSVPPPGRGSTRTPRQSSAARSCIETSPTPGLGSVGSPGRSSSTTTVRCVTPDRRSEHACRAGVADRVRHCLGADSVRPRPRPQAGRSGSRPSDPTSSRGAPGVSRRSAASRRAPTSPNSSIAGGRRASTRRRTSATAARRSPPGARQATPPPAPGRRGRGSRGAGSHPDCRERGTEAIVEVPPEPAPLLLAGHDELLSRGAQILGQERRVGRHADLLGEVVEQAHVGGRQGLRRSARRARRRADLAGCPWNARTDRSTTASGRVPRSRRETSRRRRAQLETDVRQSKRVRD